MSAVEMRQMNNPFLRSNPFSKPVKFHSQPKATLPPSLDQFQYHIPFSGVSNSLKTNSNQHSSYSLLPSLQTALKNEVSQLSLGGRKNQQKESKLNKNCIKFKENPFLRKNLLTSSKENTQPVKQHISQYQLQEKHRHLFGDQSQINKTPLPTYQDLIVNAKRVSVQKVVFNSPKKNNQPRSSFEGDTDRASWKSPSKKKYQSSELQIKLKSQTMIEQEKFEIGVGGGLLGELLSQRYEDGQNPRMIEFRGKKFYLRQIQFNY